MSGPEPPGLVELGLRAGEEVRFRRSDRARWQPGRVTRRERDGSLGISDEKGAARAIPLDLVEVRCSGSRGGAGWEPLVERAARPEQLPLVGERPRPGVRRRGGPSRGAD